MIMERLYLNNVECRKSSATVGIRRIQGEVIAVASHKEKKN